MVRRDPGALAGAALLGLLGIWAAVEAVGYGLWREAAPGEGLFPFLVAIAMTGLAGAYGAQAILREAAPPSAMADEEGPPAWRKLAVYLSGLVLFALLMEPLGYLPVTAAVLVTVLRIGERLSWTLSLAVAAATLFLSHLVFERLLGLQLPPGMLLQS